MLEFIKHPIKLSTIAPTGKKAGEKMAQLAEVNKAKIIVELGAAHGNVTKEILKLMPKNAKLYSIELTKGLYKELTKIKDERLIAIHGDATKLTEIMKKHKVTQADCVISTVPLATMPKKAQIIVNKIKETTKGPYVQIQYSKTMEKFFKKNFDKVEKTKIIKNIPPAHIYKCQ